MSNDFDKNNLVGYDQGLNGTKDDKTGMYITMLPQHVVMLNIELMKHHPDILAEIRDKVAANNYEPEIYYGSIAAACGIMLDGSYDQTELAEKLYEALVRRRSPIVLNTGQQDPSYIAMPGLTTDIIAGNLIDTDEDKTDG